MDPLVYRAVMYGDQTAFTELTNSDPSILLQLTSQDETILHVAAKYNQKRIAEVIITLQPSLAYQRNSKGDSPLHIAARLGSSETAEILVSFAKAEAPEVEAGERLLRMVNEERDTSLHVAARNGHDKVVKLILAEDPELVTLTNDAGESPLFLAVDRKHMLVAYHILGVSPLCSFQGRKNMTALHAAVVRSQDEVLKSVSYLSKFQNPVTYLTNMSFKHSLKLAYLIPMAVVKASLLNLDFLFPDFIINMVEKCPALILESDDFGWTPLHYAAHLGAGHIVVLLLKYDNLAAYIRDKQGMSMLHVAAKEGQVNILLILAEICPEIWDSQDNRGRTALHAAVEGGKLDAVKFILQIQISDCLLNLHDNDGNTALHLATIRGHRKIFELLIKNSKIDKAATNKEGLAVIDIIHLNKELGYYEKSWIALSVATNDGLASLEHTVNRAGRNPQTTETRVPEHPPQSGSREEPADRNSEAAGTTETRVVEVPANGNAEAAAELRPSYEHLRHIASINLVVTTIIATVSFAAGFTMPGGYKSDGPDQGMAILSSITAFRAFVVTNALAFCFSTASMFLHYVNSWVEKRDVLAYFTRYTTSLTAYAITAMVVAFITGTYAALADSPHLAKAVLGIGCCFFALQCLVYLK